MIERWNLAAGERRQRVIIEVKTAETTDTRGHPVRTWATYLSGVSAKIETPSGRKLELSRELVPTATHLITIQKRTLSVQTHRINYNGRIFNIGHQNNVEERGVRLELICTEEIADG